MLNVYISRGFLPSTQQSMKLNWAQTAPRTVAELFRKKKNYIGEFAVENSWRSGIYTYNLSRKSRDFRNNVSNILSSPWSQIHFWSVIFVLNF